MRGRGTRLARAALLAGVLLAFLPVAAAEKEAAEDSAGPFDPGRAGFSLKVRDSRNPYRVIALLALPDEVISLEAGREAPAGLEVTAGSGQIRAEGPGRWSWKAPAEPGLAILKASPPGGDPAMILNAFIMVPMSRVKDGYLNGYRIGEYPAKPLRGLPIYRPPPGLVEVTRDNRSTHVSPHFTLGQFLCKQESGWPKYLVLRQRLLLKLEYLLQEVNRKGIRTDSFTVMSGYRTPWYNEVIRNVKYSRHIWGGAADIFIDVAPRDGVMDDLNGDREINKLDAAFLYDLIESLGGRPAYEKMVGGLGSYGSTPSHGPFVHVDVRGFRARWGR